MVVNTELKRLVYKFINNFFGFDEWHISPVEERSYAIFLIDMINTMILEKKIENEIVEVGCGLGDIISSIKYPFKKKYGYDISENVIKAARCVHCRYKNFVVGSFGDIQKRDISILIAVNFLHAIPEDTVSECFNKILDNNNIERIVVDKVESPPYQYSHDYNIILGKNFELEYCSRGFCGWGYTRRYILVFKRRDM